MQLDANQFFVGAACVLVGFDRAVAVIKTLRNGNGKASDVCSACVSELCDSLSRHTDAVGRLCEEVKLERITRK
jgi:hypothetical protein